MKLSAVLLARALAFVETFDLDPHGSVFYPEVTAGIAERYHFQKWPKSYEEIENEKAIQFYSGKSGNVVIQKFVIFDSLLVLETRSNTSDSVKVIEDILDWGTERFGLRPRNEVIRHWAFVSNVTFTSDVDVLATSPLMKLARKTEQIVSHLWKENIEYHPLHSGIGPDPLTRKNPIAAFAISRRVETPFSENKYFSEAPVSTDDHRRLLEEYEADIKAWKP